MIFFFFFQAEDGIRDFHVTGVQTCALPISPGRADFPGGGMTRRDDGKTRALAASRTLNPRPEKVTDPAFAPGSFFDPADLVQVKYEMVRRAETGGAPAAR